MGGCVGTHSKLNAQSASLEIAQLKVLRIPQLLSEALPATSFLESLAESPLQLWKQPMSDLLSLPSALDPMRSYTAQCAGMLLLLFPPFSTSKTTNSALSVCSCRPLLPCTSGRCFCAVFIRLFRGTHEISTLKWSPTKCGLESGNLFLTT